MYKTLASNKSLENCHWKFDHYVGSPWELYWYDNIDVLQKNVCAVLLQADQTNKSIEMLEHIATVRQSMFNRSSMVNPNELFSKMFYRMECPSAHSTLVVQEIEPLVGLLRDPLTICSGFNATIPSKFVVSEDDAMQSKRFILLAPSSPYFNYTPIVPIPPWISHQHGKKFLFDIVSSYFNGRPELDNVGSAISVRWFYEYFQQNSLRFDRIIAFERGELAPKIAWDQLPEDLMTVYTLINAAVESSGKYNPLNMLQTLVKPEDYVLFKLDIDSFDLEKNLIDQIIENQTLHSLIDEIFFEMHVSVPEMEPYWSFTIGPAQLKDTYLLFTKLRQLGIRMHSWP